jgi:hypothetical protein
MAGITGLTGLNMCGRFGRGRGAIVTAGTAADYRAVIHSRHGFPGKGVMAGVTAAAGLDVCGVFTRGRSVVMTAVTGSGNGGVIHTGT